MKKKLNIGIALLHDAGNFELSSAKDFVAQEIEVDVEKEFKVDEFEFVVIKGHTTVDDKRRIKNKPYSYKDLVYFTGLIKVGDLMIFINHIPTIKHLNGYEKQIREFLSNPEGREIFLDTYKKMKNLHLMTQEDFKKNDILYSEQY